MELVEGVTDWRPAAADHPEANGTVAGERADNVVCVVGMHRSGTSFITRIMNLIGVGLGRADQIMSPHRRDNPTGYWENSAIVELNDELLEALGGSWDHPPYLAEGWEYDEPATAFRTRARALADDIVRSSRVAGWKDPRMSMLLPFWKTVVPVTATILVVRHPFQVVGSLGVRNGIVAEEGALLWSRYVVAAWRCHPHRMVVNYDAAVEDPALCAVHLAGFLGLDEPAPPSLEAITGFADRSLRHHQDHDPDIGPNMALALAIYAVIESQPFPMIDSIFDAIHTQWVRG